MAKPTYASVAATPPPSSNDDNKCNSWARSWLRSLSHYSIPPHRFVFTSALIWHTLAARSFLMVPFQVLRRVSTVRPITFLSAEIVQHLGGLNLGYAVLALQSLFLPSGEQVTRRRNALVLAVAGLSQVWLNWRFFGNGRWSPSGLLPIYIGDAFITLISILYCLQDEPSIDKESD